MDPASRDANFWTGSRDLGWDQMEWDCILADDPALCRLREQLHFRGALEYATPEQSVWRVALPATWQDYCKSLSKPYRRKIRRLHEGYFDTGRAVIKLVENAEQFDHAWEILSDLHQQRRNSLGESGCFASPAFESFHQDAARRLLQNDMLRLFWLELDGKPIAIEYALQGPDSLMVYQSGMDPACLEHEPGNIMTIELLQWQLARGGGYMDFMRGDEPYKARWRAQPQATQQVRILPGKGVDRMRRTWWRSRDRAKTWLKQHLRRAKAPRVSPQTNESE
jgi:CelD/BcsL family acetyltransferase involved in cellulose biosynthesis